MKAAPSTKAGVGASVLAALALTLLIITQSAVLRSSWGPAESDEMDPKMKNLKMQISKMSAKETAKDLEKAGQKVFGAAPSHAQGVPVAPSTRAPLVGSCGVWLPPAAPGTAEELRERLELLIESPSSPFPFGTPVGYNITLEEAHALDQAVAAAAARAPSIETASGKDAPWCPASTYDGPQAEPLARLFSPGGPSMAGAGDAILDLGAGIGKVLVAAAVVSNATLIRGVELSASRFAAGCEVLRVLGVEFARRKELATAGPLRRVELIQGDLFDLPSRVTADLPDRVAVYSYCNCFPYRLIAQIFRFAAGLERPSVRLLASKEPVRDADMPAGLRRAGFTGTIISSLFERRTPGASASPRGRRSLRGPPPAALLQLHRTRGRPSL